MYFQLLHGIHLERGKKYEVTIDRDAKTGEVKVLKQPIIETEKNLVDAFGANKFRRIYPQEMDNLLLVGGKKNVTSSDPPTTDKEESEVSKAAKKGAVGIAEVPGVDVTDKFPEIQDYDTASSLRIYFKRPKGYVVVDDGNIVTDVPLKRDELLDWVKVYKGK